MLYSLCITILCFSAFLYCPRFLSCFVGFQDKNCLCFSRYFKWLDTPIYAFVLSAAKNMHICNLYHMLLFKDLLSVSLSKVRQNLLGKLIW